VSKIPDDVQKSDLNVIARNVLLDGLEALREHLASVTVVGAQAVYLRTQNVQFATAAFTSDGDLGLDPRTLDDEPLIQERLKAAGLAQLNDNQPGLWGRRVSVGGLVVPVELDLLVGEKLAGTGTRSANIKPHDKMTARRVPGLETAVVDRSPMTIAALDGSDRSAHVNVAGPVALLVAKAHKIRDRLANPPRLTNKDAGDVYRLMVGVPQREIITAFRTLLHDPLVGDVTTTGLKYLRDQFGGAAAPGVLLAIEAMAGDVPAERIRLVAPAYVAALDDLG
jgi:hypothetical protein